MFVGIDATIAYKVHTLSAECDCLSSRAHFTGGLQLAVGFLHPRVECFHPVDEERSGQCVWVVVWQQSGLTTVGAGERLVGWVATGECEDALLAVVVTTREQLWLLVAVMTDATGHLLLQISYNWIRSFGHR